MAKPQSKQLPQGVPFVDSRNMVDYRWVSVLNALQGSLPPPGAGYVVDGSGGNYGTMTLFQGLDANKGGQPTNGSIYFALDTGKIYSGVGGSWILLSPEYTGDVHKGVHETEIILNNVNPNPGTWGSISQYPVITVNEKGLITGVSLEQSSTGNQPGGVTTSVQYNNNGTFAGDTFFTYNGQQLTLYVPRIRIADQITFLNPIPTFTNLSPLRLKGDILTHDGTINVRKAIGQPNQILGVDGIDALEYKTLTASSGIDISHTVGGVTFFNTGVLQITPGNGIVVTPSGGTGVVELEADIVWGDITGDIANQPDLVEALDDKVDVAGDTMTGPLYMTDGTWTSSMLIDAPDATSNPELQIFGGIWNTDFDDSDQDIGVRIGGTYIAFESNDISMHLNAAFQGCRVIVTGLTERGNAILGVEPPPVPDYVVSTGSNDDVTIYLSGPTPSPWVPVTGTLTVTRDILPNLATIYFETLVENTGNKEGSFELGVGIDGAEPTSINSIEYGIGPGVHQTFSNTTINSFFIANGTTATLYARAVDANNTFNIFARNSQRPSLLKLTVVGTGGGGGGGTVTSVNVVGTTGNISATGGPITNAGVITIDLENTSVVPGTYTSANIVVDEKGRITSAGNGSGGGGGGGTVTSVTVAGTDGIVSTGSPITINGTITLELGDITPDSVTSVGPITGSNISGANSGDQTITLSGDATGVSTGAPSTDLPVTLVDTGVVAGDYTSANISVDSKGRILSATSGTGGTGEQTPTIVHAGETFIVQADKQVLFAQDIIVEGTMIVEGSLIDVRPVPVPDSGNVVLGVGTIIRTNIEPTALGQVWVKCDGRILAKTDYSELYFNIGISWQQHSYTQFDMPLGIQNNFNFGITFTGGSWIVSTPDPLDSSIFGISYSTDLTSWTFISLPTPGQIQSVACDALGKVVLLLAGTGGALHLVYSTDFGLTWNNCVAPLLANFSAVISFNGSHYVGCIGDGAGFSPSALVSADGITWTLSPTWLNSGLQYKQPVWINNKWIFYPIVQNAVEVRVNFSSDLSTEWFDMPTSGLEGASSSTYLMNTNGYWNVNPTIIVSFDALAVSIDGLNFAPIQLDPNYPITGISGGADALPFYIGNKWILLNMSIGNLRIGESIDGTENFILMGVQNTQPTNFLLDDVEVGFGYLGDLPNYKSAFTITSLSGTASKGVLVQPNHDVAHEFNIPNLPGNYIRIS